MTKKEKESLTAEINKIVAPMGGSFRFRTMRDINENGVFWPETRRIVIKWTAGPRTLAHEIAHLDEYNQFGETDCTRGRHFKIQELWIKKLNQQGIYKKYLNLVG